MVGPALHGSVVIVDDVISAGTSVRESRRWIEQAGATTGGVLIALDRQERGEGTQSAVASVESQGIPVVAVATLQDLILWLKSKGHDHLAAVEAYQATYGA